MITTSARSTVTPASCFNRLSNDDLEDIRSRFSHTSARSYAADLRDLHESNLPRRQAPLTFALRSVFPSNIR